MTRIFIENQDVAIEINAEERIVSLVGVAPWNTDAVFWTTQLEEITDQTVRQAVMNALKDLQIDTLLALRMYYAGGAA
jgi:hypothetical protein